MKNWFNKNSGNLKDLEAILAQRVDKIDYPHSTRIEENIPIYEGRSAIESDRINIMEEWVEVLLHGPGIMVIKKAYPNKEIIEKANVVFEEIMLEEKACGNVASDHFAKPGKNDRIWNVLEKHCRKDPDGFTSYYSNIVIATVAEAWLGPGYQITAQVNRVNPGGKAQSGHRDYHLGFMTIDQAARFPAHVHSLSPALTLQGAVAHCDMPRKSGPTLFLPFSHHLKEGYLSFQRSDFQDLFIKKHVQLEFEIGDAVFFNPAIMHAAGKNSSKDVFRMINLLQISSAFGRPMEFVDRMEMCKIVYPILLSRNYSKLEKMSVIAAVADGYPFPTNLDKDPPVDGLAPHSQAQLMTDALNKKLNLKNFKDILNAHTLRRQR